MTKDQVEMSPHSLIQQYRKDDIEQQYMYRDTCQQVLDNISSVKCLVNDLQQSKDMYYPTTSKFSIFKIDHDELLVDSLPQLLDKKLSSCIGHLNNLTKRVSDTSSKVLITGDLNSGKSTLVNALLKQDILPVDQQPCTSLFCEVLPCKDMNSVTIHAVKEDTTYHQSNQNTFHPIETRHLYKLLTDEDQQGYKMLKIYSPRDENLITKTSLLHNGVIDIALIDSPGLNTDSVKTTAVFAREEEIDVVVFVVSAENHFTLSGKEFLWNAANEKTHIFIVVNRFDNIRDKDRCKRLILEQIKQLSPATFERAEDLVHFVSAEHQVEAPDFIKLEQRLRSFVLNNRMESKLLPAKNYLENVLRDIYFISTVNESKSSELVDSRIQVLETDFLPGYSNLINIQKILQHDIQHIKEKAMTSIEQLAINSLNDCTSEKELNKCIQSIEYPGLLLTWQYAQDIADSLRSRLQDNLQSIEDNICQETYNQLKQMNTITTEKLKDCSIGDITTKVQKNALTTSNYRPIQVKVQARDFLLNRQLVDDKKVALSGLATASAATILFKAINLKDVALNIMSRYFNPFDDSTGLPPRRYITITLTTVGVLSVGWAAYSFISVIPQAIQTNLKHKFQTAVKNEKFVHHQSHRMTHSVENVLEAKKTEILYRLKQVVAEKENEKTALETSVFQSKSTLHHFKTLVSQSDALLVKVQESLLVSSSSSSIDLSTL